MQGYMPVFMQAPPAQPAQVPQGPLQPAPVDPNLKKIKEAHAHVEKYQKRLKCTSGTLIIVGCIGFIASIYWQFNTMHAVHKMVHGPPPPPPHHKYGERHGPPPPPPPKEEGDKFITRDEFDLYDSLKTMCALSIFMFAKLIALGKCGKRMAWKNKYHATHRLHKKSCFVLLILIVTTILMWRQGKGIHHIMDRIHRNKPEHHKAFPERFEFPQEEGAIFNVDGRHLKEVDLLTTHAAMTFELKDDEEVCHVHGDEGSCHTNEKCSWCTAGAVPPACHSLNNAATLPPAVFECSPLPSTEKKQPKEVASTVEDKMQSVADKAADLFNEVSKIPEIFLKDDEDTCHALGTDSACEANKKCSWCISAAVASACHSIANAQRLPSAVFSCSGLDAPQEEQFGFFKMLDRMRGGRNHGKGERPPPPPERFGEEEFEFEGEEEDEERPRFGGKGHKGRQGKHGQRGQHGKHDKHDKHDKHRGPRVQADSTEPMQIIAGMPVKGHIAAKLGRHQERFGDDEEFDGPPRHGRHGKHGRHHERFGDDEEFDGPPRHGKHGEHGKHHKKHGCAGCSIFKVFMILLLGVHFMCIKGLKHHQEHFAILTGKPIEHGCKKWKKHHKHHGKKHHVAEANAQQQPQQIIVTQPVVEYSSNNSVAEIHEERDKEMGMVFAPNPSTLVLNQNSMI